MAIFRSNAHVVWACLANTGIIKRLDLVLDPDLLLDLNYLHLDPDLPLDLNNRSKDVPVKPFLLGHCLGHHNLYQTEVFNTKNHLFVTE